MFALEINFIDGVSGTETIFVRRPQALIGGSDYAHVVIEDMQSLGYHLRISRDIGRKFSSRVVSGNSTSAHPELDHDFDGEGALDLGPLKLYITALDTDLGIKEAEPLDRAGARIMRHACSHAAPNYPALMVSGANPITVSFSGEQGALIGRSKQCLLRLDASDVSAKHAKITYEGGDFWVEDLGSTNGTFVDHQQISGRSKLPKDAAVVVGREISIRPISSDNQAVSVKRERDSGAHLPVKGEAQETYPIVVSASELARPARLVLKTGSILHVGRDPTCDMWLGAPHVSRKHCRLEVVSDEKVVVTDLSTNGTAYDGGILRKGESLMIKDAPKVLDFGSGITVGICFKREEEARFASGNGAVSSFRQNAEIRDHRVSWENGRNNKVRPQRPERATGNFGFAFWLKQYYFSKGVLGKLLLMTIWMGLLVVSFLVAALFVKALISMFGL